MKIYFCGNIKSVTEESLAYVHLWQVVLISWHTATDKIPCGRPLTGMHNTRLQLQSFLTDFFVKTVFLYGCTINGSTFTSCFSGIFLIHSWSRKCLLESPGQPGLKYKKITSCALLACIYPCTGMARMALELASIVLKCSGSFLKPISVRTRDWVISWDEKQKIQKPSLTKLTACFSTQLFSLWGFNVWSRWCKTQNIAAILPPPGGLFANCNP